MAVAIIALVQKAWKRDKHGASVSDEGVRDAVY